MTCTLIPTYIEGLNLPSTVKEMRERIMNSKKRDSRTEDSGCLWKKLSIVESM